jgi:hypothetical protein
MDVSRFCHVILLLCLWFSLTGLLISRARFRQVTRWFVRFAELKSLAFFGTISYFLRCDGRSRIPTGQRHDLWLSRTRSYRGPSVGLVG